MTELQKVSRNNIKESETRALLDGNKELSSGIEMILCFASGTFPLLLT